MGTFGQYTRSWRAEAKVYRRAFREALSEVEFSRGVSLLAALDTLVANRASANKYDPLVEAFNNTVIFERNGRDMLLLQTVLNLSSAQLDTLFRRAMEIERQNQS